MDVHITYETLFDLLRKERSLQELQTLDTYFWKHVINYMKEREEASSTGRPGEQEKAKIQLQNVQRILKEIYERRERKIVDLALNVIRTENAGYIDTNSMLAEEKVFFDETLAMLRRYKEGVISKVFRNELPDVVPQGHYDGASEESSGDDGEGGEASDEKTGGDEGGVNLDETDTGQRSSEEVVEDKPVDEIRNDTGTSDEGDEGVIVRFTTSVPKFYGKNKEIYGPYSEKQIVTLPSMIANILLKKGKVEKVTQNAS